MNKSRAWIVEEFIPEGMTFAGSERNRSRFVEWKERRSAKHPGRHVFDQGSGKCIFCKIESAFVRPATLGEPLDLTCPKAPYPRAEHWQIIRMDRDRWEGVRRRDRMVLEQATVALRSIHAQHRGKKTLRVRNIRTEDVIMGALLTADMPVEAPLSRPIIRAAFVGGASHSKN